MDLVYQCCICKNSISDENLFDPCGLTIFTNANNEIGNQREQTFYCHIDCFKKTYNDPSTFYLEDSNTLNEYKEETESIAKAMGAFAELLFFELTKDHTVSSTLFNHEKGIWQKALVVFTSNEFILDAIIDLEKTVYDNIWVSWLETHNNSSNDFSNKNIVIAIGEHFLNPTIISVNVQA